MARQNAFRSPDDIEDRAITVRPSSTSLLTIDSSDRYATLQEARDGNVSPYQFSISRNQNIMTGFVSRIALTEIVFPWYLPNVDYRTNQLFVVSSEIGPGTTVISFASNEEGFYTPTELAAALQTKLIAAGAVSATVTYDEGGYMVFDAGAGNTFEFAPGTDTLNANPLWGPNDYQLCDMIGFNAAVQAFQPTQLVPFGPSRCRWTEYIDIVCSQLTYNQDLKDQSSDTVVRDALARVYLETENEQTTPVWDSVSNKAIVPTTETIPGTFPYTIYRQFKTPKQIKWNKSQPIGNLTFEVYDDKGRLLTSYSPSSNLNFLNLNWRMTLLVSEN